MRRSRIDVAALLGAVVKYLIPFILVVFGTLQVEDGSVSEASPEAEIVEVAPVDGGTVDVAVDGVDDDRQADDTVEVPEDVIEEAEAALESDLQDQTPAAALADPAQLEDVQATVDKVKRTKEPLPTAGASQGFPGCRTSFVRNQSSRGGVRPIWQVLHYTVSPNRVGWDDVNGIVAFFNNTSSQASSNFVIDREGNCAYIVPIEAKPWTQAAGNPLSIAYEIINTGSESPFMESAGYDRLRSVMAEVSRRTGIPLGRGSVYPARTGTVQHADGGTAWGGHHDIGPFSISQVVAIVGQPAKVKISDADRSSCKAVVRYRKRRKGDDKAARQAARKPKNQKRQQDRVKRLHGRGLYCTGDGKVKRK